MTIPRCGSLRPGLDRLIRSGAHLVVLLLLTCFAVRTGMAQTPPAGNAHPENHALSFVEGEVPNPFGTAEAPAPAVTPEAKSTLARGVDLSPLRGLAVFHNGRVKTLDTLARETISAITGRARYFDTLASGEKFTYDSLFTLLDLLIDDGYYRDKPLLYVNYLPLRRLFLERSFPASTPDPSLNAKNQREQERWMHLQRISPLMVLNHVREIINQHGIEPQWNQGLGRLDQELQLWRMSVDNLMMVTPPSTDQPWQHLSRLEETDPARQAALRMGRAWRAGDPAAVNEAAKALSELLPAIHPDVYPTQKLRIETAYNKANAFEWGFWAYFLSLVTFMLAFGTGRAWLRRAGLGLLMVAVGLHAFGFVTRCFIAERFAIQNQFESMTGLSLFAVTAGLAITLARRQAIFGAAAAAVGFLVLVTATQTGIPGEDIGREAAILNTSVLLKYHVTTVLVSYGLISLGFVVSLFYLGTHYFVRSEPSLAGAGGGEVAAAALGLDSAGEVPVGGKARLLHDLDTAQMIVLQLAFWTLGVGILLGAWWADHSWGRWWAFDPKETWALVTWIIYLMVIHLRFTTTRRGLVTAWMSIVGFVMMLWTYFGVNLLLPGLHAYA